MKLKNLPPVKNNGLGPKIDPNSWIAGPDPVQRDKYYGWLRHKSQASYRGETYTITWEDWQKLWPNDLWFQRGKRSECVILVRLDPDGDWDMSNVTTCLMKDKGQYYRRNSK